MEANILGGGTVREFENFKYAQSFVRAMLS